jgi:hypothetical protein
MRPLKLSRDLIPRYLQIGRLGRFATERPAGVFSVKESPRSNEEKGLGGLELLGQVLASNDHPTDARPA